MFCNFRKTFYPTEEEKKQQKEFLESIKLPNKNEIKLVKANNKIFKDLYVSEPFQDFIGQCEGCKHFSKYYPYFIEGGECKLHKCSCGWGFTCNDYKFKTKE